MGFLDDIFGIGKKIKDTVLTTSPASFIKDRLSDVAGATFQNVKKSIEPVTNYAKTYVQNRYTEPIKQGAISALKLSPPGQLYQSLTRKSTPLSQGDNLLKAVMGIASVVPDPIQDIAMPAVDFTKGVSASAIRGGTAMENVKAGLQSASLEKPVGIGSAITTNPTGETVGNIAELPVMLAMGALRGKGGKLSVEEIIKNAKKDVQGNIIDQGAIKLLEKGVNKKKVSELIEKAKGVPIEKNGKNLMEIENSDLTLPELKKKLDIAIEGKEDPELIDIIKKDIKAQEVGGVGSIGKPKFENPPLPKKIINQFKEIRQADETDDPFSRIPWEKSPSNKMLQYLEGYRNINNAKDGEVQSLLTQTWELAKKIVKEDDLYHRTDTIGAQAVFDKTLERLNKAMQSGDRTDAVIAIDAFVNSIHQDFPASLLPRAFDVQDPIGAGDAVGNFLEFAAGGNWKKTGMYKNMREAANFEGTNPTGEIPTLSASVPKITPPLSPTAEIAGRGVVTQPRKTAQQIIQETMAKPRDVNTALKTGAINPDEAVALKGNVGELIAKSKQRGFVGSVQEATTVNKKVKAGVTGEYTTKPNPILMGEAKALLEEGASIDIKHIKDIDKKVAATIQEAINQQKANPQIAANLFNNLSEQGTELGRGVHAFSMIDKMTPEAIALSVAGRIKKYNMTARKPIPELNGDQVKLITDKMASIDGLSGREKNIALADLQTTLNEFIPSSIVDKAVTVWKAGLLTSLRTHERNLIGNTIMAASEIVKDPFASVADMIMAAKTGKRSMTTTLKGSVAGAKKGTQAMIDTIRYGYDPEEAITKFDIKKITWGKNPVEQFLKKATDAVFRPLSGEDKIFWHSAYARSLYDQAGAEAINAGKQGNMKFIEKLVKKPTEEMLKVALTDANTATFHDKNAIGNVASSIKRAASSSKLGPVGSEVGKALTEVLAPFTGVPSSIVGKTMAYSPIGLVKGAIDVGRVLLSDVPNLQRQAAQEIGRGVVGSGLFGLGAYLMSKGLMTGQPKDAKEADLWAAEGKQANSVLIGGKWRSINSIGPQNLVMLAGAKFQEEMGNPEGGDVGAYAGGLAKDQLSQTFLAGVQGPLNAITDPARYGKSYVGNQTASVIPNIVKDTARAFDPSMRENNSVIDYIKAGIPGLRNTLTEKRDVLGREMPQEPTGIAAFFDLFNSKSPVENAVVEELSRLAKSGNEATPSKMGASQTIQKEKVKLTFEQLNDLEKGVGEALKPQLETLIASDSYKKLDDEAKAKAIDAIVKDVRLKYKNVNAEDILSPSEDKLAIRGATVTPDGTEKPTIGEDQTFSYVDDQGNYKTIDVGKVATMPDDTRYEKTLKQKAAFGLINNILDNLPKEKQAEALAQIGVEEKIATYYNMARQGDDEKYSYVLDSFEGMTTREEMLKNLVKGRFSVNGKMIVSNGVVDNLYNDGYITLDESKRLKKMEIDENGNSLKKTTPSGSSTAKKTANKTAMKSIASDLISGPKTGSMQALIAETKARREPPVKIPNYSPDVTLSKENAKNTVPVALKTSDLISKAKNLSGMAKARAIIDSVRGGGSTGSAANVPMKLSRSSYRPSLRK